MGLTGGERGDRLLVVATTLKEVARGDTTLSRSPSLVRVSGLVLRLSG
jgi:hypothetical protein